MRTDLFHAGFGSLFRLDEEEGEYVGHSGSVEIRFMPRVTDAANLRSASLFFPRPKAGRSIASLATISSELFITLATGEANGSIRWVETAEAKLSEEGFYEEHQNNLTLRLSSAGTLLHLGRRFDPPR